MNLFSTLALTALLVGIAPAANAQQNTNIRGTLAAFDGKMLSVRTHDGQEVSVDLPADARISTTKAFGLADIKPGMVLGVTTVRRGEATVAIDVRPIPPTAPQGLSPHDLQPESTMTNAVMEGEVQTSTSAAGAQELTLNYKTGTVKVLVPPGTPMSQAAPGVAEDLKPGETVYVAARRNDAGRLVALRVQVSKDGVKPTQ